MTEHIAFPNGDQEWKEGGQLHRDGGLTAVIRAYGTQRWYQDGWLHQNGDQPAFIYADGTKAWYQNDIMLSTKEVLELKRQTIFKRNLSCAHAIYSVHTNRDVAGVVCSFCV